MDDFLITAGTGNPLLDHFRYIDTPDVALVTGVEYVIAYYSDVGGGDLVITNAAGLVVHPAVVLGTARVGLNQGGLGLPPITTEGDRFGPNFQFATVPEGGVNFFTDPAEFEEALFAAGKVDKALSG